MEILSADTLVVVGAWNKAIFSEEWIVENVLREGVQYSLEYPLNVLGSLKFSTENCSFYIFDNRLSFRRNNERDASCLEIIEYASIIFQKLIHTPVTALGVNFLYQVPNVGEKLNNLPQNADFVNAIGHDIASLEILRTFSLTEKETLNLKVEQKDNNTILNFNFNFNINSLLDALNIIGDSNEIILKKKGEASNIVKILYPEND